MGWINVNNASFLESRRRLEGRPGQKGKRELAFSHSKTQPIGIPRRSSNEGNLRLGKEDGRRPDDKVEDSSTSTYSKGWERRG